MAKISYMKYIILLSLQLSLMVFFSLASICQNMAPSGALVMSNYRQDMSVLGSRDGYHIGIIGFGAEHALAKIGADSWASGGTGVVEQGASGALFTNPACMDFQSLTVSAELTGRLKTKTYLGFDYDGIVYPSFVSVGMKKDNWNLSAGYLNYFNYAKSNYLPETTPEYPEGTGNYYTFETNIKVHSFFGSANCSSEKLTYGLTLGLNYLVNSESWGNTNTSENGLGLLAIAGLLASPSEQFNIGLSFKFATPIEYTSKPLTEEYIYRAAFPWGFELGLSGELSPIFRVLASVDFQNWKDVSPGMQNELNIHLGTVIEVSQYNNLRFGFFTQSDPILFYKPYFDQNFLSGGFQTGDEHITISLTILDSHLFNREELISYNGDEHQFHQTIISLGGTYRFE